MNTVWPPVGCLLPSLYQQLRREVASIHNTCTKLVTRKLPVLTSSRRQRTWMRTAISRTTPESATCARRQAADQQQQAAAAKLQLIVAGGYQLVTGITSRRQRTWMRTTISRTTPESGTSARSSSGRPERNALLASVPPVLNSPLDASPPAPETVINGDHGAPNAHSCRPTSSPVSLQSASGVCESSSHEPGSTEQCETGAIGAGVWRRHSSVCRVVCASASWAPVCGLLSDAFPSPGRSACA